MPELRPWPVAAILTSCQSQPTNSNQEVSPELVAMQAGRDHFDAQDSCVFAEVKRDSAGDVTGVVNTEHGMGGLTDWKRFRWSDGVLTFPTGASSMGPSTRQE